MLNNFVFSVKNGHYIKTHDTNYKYVLSLVVVLDFFLQPKALFFFYLLFMACKFHWSEVICLELEF